jgi:translation elongation factor EF-4
VIDDSVNGRKMHNRRTVHENDQSHIQYIYTKNKSSIYPLDTQDFDSLELAVNKLTLNDASVSVQVRLFLTFLGDVYIHGDVNFF